MTTPEQQAPIDALISHLDDAATHVKALIAERDALKAELAAIKQGAPSNRPAVPLTEEQIVDLVRDAGLDWQSGWTLEDDPNRYLLLARAIEAAHNIKGA